MEFEDVIAGSMKLEELINMWFELLEYSKTTIDSKVFRTNSDKYAKMWSRLTYEEQGYITEVISFRLLE